MKLGTNIMTLMKFFLKGMQSNRVALLICT